MSTFNNDELFITFGEYMESLGCSRSNPESGRTEKCTIEGHGAYHLYCTTAMDAYMSMILS